MNLTSLRRTAPGPALLAGLLVGVLAGCGSADSPTAAAEPTASHTMADGTVMSGSEMPGMATDEPSDAPSDGSSDGADESTEDPAPIGPSPAARMVCSGDVVADVTRILALEEAPSPTSAWAEPVFTCTFELDQGPLVLSVHDASEEPAGRAYFDTLRTELGETEELRGMYGLGLPAYETDDGTVVFIKDGKTLEVDATALPGKLGPDRSMSQTDLAYAVATSVLACWTQHA